jgi:major type 1 subunit fimbrin (pilin)
MKKLSRTLAMLGVLGAGAIPVSSFAVDGTVTFTGQVTTSTCSIDGATGQDNKAITLPQVSSKTLQNAGDVAGATPVTIVLSGCGGQTGARVHWEPDTNVDPNGMLKNIATLTPATNVVVQLLNSSLQPINVLTNGNNMTFTTLTAGNATLNYYAQYYAADAVASGGVSAVVRFSIAYQ